MLKTPHFSSIIHTRNTDTRIRRLHAGLFPQVHSGQTGVHHPVMPLGGTNIMGFTTAIEEIEIMDRLWAPWRMEYIINDKPSGCIFCVPATSDMDRECLILHRTELSFVMLNRYPYTNGHLLIAPRRHTADMDDLSDAEMLDLFSTMRLCRNVLREAASPEGFNAGINMGRAAGAGVDEHIHLHMVPRWNGDTNFMSVLGDVRVMPENLAATYDRLLPAFIAFREKKVL